MKPHEEEWTAEGERIYTDYGKGPFAFARVHAHARARLAAQAPAMARLLLSLQCAGTDNSETVIHKLGCSILITLRAAGVLP